MRPITAWITAAITVMALWASYQANQNGVTGKSGDQGGATTDHPARPGDEAGHIGKSGERK
jgi:hypothetical protein